MKKILLFIAFIGFTQITIAQSTREQTEKGVGFRKENVFVGGTISLGFGSRNDPFFGTQSSFLIGGTPEIGYSFAEWLDLGIAVNINYQTTRFNDNVYRYRQNMFNYGIGAFARLHPIKNFFVQLQPENNWINVTQRNLDLSSQPKITFKVSAPSVLAGIGYGQRLIGNSSFYTVVLFDVNKNINSPYRDFYGNALPIIRSGFTFYLKPSKKSRN